MTARLPGTAALRCGLLLFTVGLACRLEAAQETAESRRLPPTFIVGGSETVVASAVVTAAPYNADSSGERDVSGAIQKALDAVVSVDGGVVFLPAGRYRLESGLRVGYGTTLRGEWQEPDTLGAFSGTVLLACTGSGSEDGSPLIEVPPHRETAVIGVCICRPTPGLRVRRRDA